MGDPDDSSHDDSAFSRSTKTLRSPAAPKLPSAPENPTAQDSKDQQVWLCLKFATRPSSLAIRKALRPVIPLRLSEYPDRNEIHLQLGSPADATAVQASPPCGASISTISPAGCKGTIFSLEMASWTQEEIMEELGDSVSGVTPFPPAAPTPGRFLVHFKARTPPQSVTLACGLLLSVRAVAPLPLRCRKCLAYGHHERLCKRKPRCSNCSQEGHALVDCIRNPFCRPCNAPHPVTDPKCPTFQREREAARIRAQDNCTINSARKKAEAKLPPTVAPRPPAPARAIPTPTAAPKELFPPLPQRAPQNEQPNPSVAQSTQQQILSLMAQQMSLLATLVDQNKAIMQQNSKILELLGAKWGDSSPPQKEGKRRRKQSGATTVPPPSTPGTPASTSQHTILSLWKPQPRTQPEEDSTTNDEGGKN